MVCLFRENTQKSMIVSSKRDSEIVLFEIVAVMAQDGSTEIHLCWKRNSWNEKLYFFKNVWISFRK